MIQIVNKIKKYKYPIGSFLIVLFFIVTIYLNQKERNIYVLFETNFSECSNINDYYRKQYYVICHKNNTILFEKRKDKKSKIKKLETLNDFDVISKEKLFKEFPDSIIFGSLSEFPSKTYKKYNVYLIITDKFKNQINIIQVKQVQILS